MGADQLKWARKTTVEAIAVRAPTSAGGTHNGLHGVAGTLSGSVPAPPELLIREESGVIKSYSGGAGAEPAVD